MIVHSLRKLTRPRPWRLRASTMTKYWNNHADDWGSPFFLGNNHIMKPVILCYTIHNLHIKKYGKEGIKWLQCLAVRHDTPSIGMLPSITGKVSCGAWMQSKLFGVNNRQYNICSRNKHWNIQEICVHTKNNVETQP